MGELAGNFQDSPEAKIAGDRDQAVEPEAQDQGDNQDQGDIEQEQPKGIETHVPEVFADAINKRDNLPVFKVKHNEFYQNMNYGRQRIRFKSGTPAQKFMQGSRYKQSFWIQHEKDGYMRKIK